MKQKLPNNLKGLKNIFQDSYFFNLPFPSFQILKEQNIHPQVPCMLNHVQAPFLKLGVNPTIPFMY